jgi:hypothetical protein
LDILKNTQYLTLKKSAHQTVDDPFKTTRKVAPCIAPYTALNNAAKATLSIAAKTTPNTAAKAPPTT